MIAEKPSLIRHEGVQIFSIDIQPGGLRFATGGEDHKLGSTFFRRLGWSPCGHFITTTHGFQKPRHSAPFNHSMFRINSSSAPDVKASSAGWSNGASKPGGKESWSPDGYSLFACSLDGSVATFHFEGKKIGQRLTEKGWLKALRNCYGDVRGRQANLAESPAQLLLEAAAVKHTPRRKVSKDAHPGQAVSKPSSDCT
ncbi:hypothetical protein RND81_01G018300 [Saponaria officinalis]|uniref:Uncharacterized protein n=1 Tax=Saponaria officinalis TaxID=3572 RepID=A0AAW1NAW8_SAPOF